MNAALQELAKKREARHGVPSTGAGDEDAAVSTIQACHRSKSDPEKAQEAKPIAPSASDTGYRCWICLDDSDSLEGMISPCACVGTNQYVHQECVKTYCLQHLSNHEPSSRELNVACPICKTQYTITEQSAAATSAASGDGGSASGAVSAADGLGGNWSEFTQWSTDRHLLLRHGRFLLLVAPLVGASLISWSWLLAYWHDLYVHGPGEPLMEGEPLGDRLDPAVDSADEPEALLRSSTVNLLSPVQELLLGARSWLPQGFVDAAEELLPAAFSRAEGAAASAYTTPAFDVAGSAASERQPHPAGISKKWSVLYVWLQYVQWYKVRASRRVPSYCPPCEAASPTPSAPSPPRLSPLASRLASRAKRVSLLPGPLAHRPCPWPPPALRRSSAGC